MKAGHWIGVGVVVAMILLPAFAACAESLRHTLQPGEEIIVACATNAPCPTCQPLPTATPPPTDTPIPPTATSTPVPPTVTNTPLPTNTPVPPTPTNTPLPTNTPVPPTVPPTATNTPVPPTATPQPGGLWYGVARVPVEQVQAVRNAVGGDIVNINVRNLDALPASLDAVAAAGYTAIVDFRGSTAGAEAWAWNDATGQWDISAEVRAALAVCADHPACAMVYLLHEPFHRPQPGWPNYTYEQQSALYAQVKPLVDGKPLYSEVSRLEGAGRTDEQWHDGICDYCGILAHQFRTDWTSERSLTAMRTRMDTDSAIQQQWMPGSRLIFLPQTFGRASTNHRMPTPDELRTIRDYACSLGIPVMYYPWTHGSYTENLEDAPQALYDAIKEGCP